MKLTELDKFRLDDAIKFHDELNPALFKNEELRAEVRDRLLLIAEDFIEYLGISDLDIEDITISGSNAAYSYTKHSDIDLHILVDMTKLSNDEIYKELFKEKKNLYNEYHDIFIRGYEVELYVQDAAEPVISLGEYSVLHDKWLHIPKKRRSGVDETAARLKYEKLADIADAAIKAKDEKKIDELLRVIKRYRQAGLDKHGEFGPENLAFKVLRTQGVIDKLHQTKNDLHDIRLSLPESSPLNKKTLSVDQLAKRHKVTVQQIKAQLKKGIQVELEHTYDKKIAMQIALDHLKEDPNYYTKLNKANLEESTGIPKTVYHVTLKKNLNPILARGLIPKIGDRSKKIGEDTPAIYCFKDKDSVHDALMNWLGDELEENEELALLAISTFGLPVKTIDGADYEIAITSRIPPSNIKVVSDLLESILVEYETHDYQQLSESKTSYKEIEFVCVNPNFPDATDAELQQHLFNELKKIPNVIPLMQDWDEYDEGQRSLSAIYKDQSARNAIIKLAKKLGVQIDLEQEVSSDYVDRAIRGEHEGQVNEEKTATHLQKLPKFFKGNDPLAELVPERKTHTFALHPDKWISTFYSLTGKDPEKLRYYKPAKVEIVPGTLVGDMVFANKFYRAKTDEEKEAAALKYKKSLKPYDQANVDDYRMPELLIPRSVNESASGYIPSKKEANDPRFKTALTVDIKPDTMQKNAAKLGSKIKRNGVPPLLREEDEAPKLTLVPIPEDVDPAELIRTECSEFLKMLGSSDTFLYRGIKGALEKNIPVAFWDYTKPRKKPMDTPVEIQTVVDTVLKSAGFTALRGNSLYCTSSFSFAEIYGKDNVYYIFPKNGFTFTWSEKYKDFYEEFVSQYPGLDSFLTGEKGVPLPARKSMILRCLRLLKRDIQSNALSISDEEKKKAIMFIEEVHQFLESGNRMDSSNKDWLEPRINSIVDITGSHLNSKTDGMFISKYSKAILLDLWRWVNSNVKIDWSSIDVKELIDRHGLRNDKMHRALQSGHEILINGEYYAFHTNWYDMKTLLRR
jgi:hypothetical protein